MQGVGHHNSPHNDVHVAPAALTWNIPKRDAANNPGVSGALLPFDQLDISLSL